MSFFHEMMREILEDVQKFLILTLQHEHLSAASISHKETLLMKIHHLRNEYPQLHLQLIPDIGSQNLSAGGSPPPYTDMQGSQNPVNTDFVYSNSLEEEYEVCDAQSNANVRQTRSLEQECSSSITEGKGRHESNYAADSNVFLKSGYLEKKGKDRLGGLINNFQRRWVAIKDGCLLLFNKNTDKKPCNQLSLFGYEARVVAFTNKEGGKKDCCFELIGPGRKTYQFLASSRSDANDWVEIIRKVISSFPYENTLTLPPSSQYTSQSDGSQGSSGDGSAVVRILSNVNSFECQNGTEDMYEILPEDNSNMSSATEEELYQDTNAAASAVENSIDTIVKQETNVTNNRPTSYSLDLYVGLWDCQACEVDELEFKRGDIIKVLSKEFDDHLWWVGELNGTIGLVPKQYLMEAYELNSATGA